MNYPSLVSLREVAPRDGWQKFKTVLPTEVKRELICSMIDYGARELEIGVFSSDPVRGRQYQDLDSLCQMVLPYAAEKGVRVTALVESVDESSCAAKAGLEKGDIITAINGIDVTTMEQLNRVKNQFTAGQTVTLTIYRSGSSYDVEIILMDRANA